MKNGMAKRTAASSSLEPQLPKNERRSGQLRPGKGSHRRRLESNSDRPKRKPVKIPADFEQFEKLELATTYMTKRLAGLSERQRRDIQRDWLDGLSYRDRYLLHVMNPWAGDLWSRFLLKAYDEHHAGQTHFAVTILDHDWDLMVGNFTHVDPTALHRIVGKMRKQLQQAFRGVSFLFMVDVSIDRRARARDNERRLCCHLHGIVWLDRPAIRKAGRYFAGGHYGAPSVEPVPIHDPQGWLSYASRDQRLGNYWWVDRTNWKPSYGRENEPICSGQRQHLLRLFRNVTKPDLCIASGVGQAIKLRALRLAKGAGYMAPERGNDWCVELPGHDVGAGPLPAPELDPYYLDD